MYVCMYVSCFVSLSRQVMKIKFSEFFNRWDDSDWKVAFKEMCGETKTEGTSVVFNVLEEHGVRRHKLYSVHVELALHIALIHSAIRGCMLCAIDYSRGFWYGTLPCSFMFEVLNF